MATDLFPPDRPQPPQRLPLQYEIARELGIVTLHGTDPQLDESDLTRLLIDLQTGDADLADGYAALNDSELEGMPS